MFKPVQLRKIVAGGVTAYNGGDRGSILESLNEFKNIWESQGCKNYIMNFGKAVGVLKNKDYQGVEMFERDWLDFFNSGTYLSLAGLLRHYDPEKLLVSFSKINRLSDLMSEHEKEIDKAFLNNSI